MENNPGPLLSSPTPPSPAYQVACFVWHELTGRKGVGNELESYHPSTQRNIFYALVECAESVISRLGGIGYEPAEPPSFLFDEDGEFTTWPTKAD
ncbi:hypothetical protein [Deinococcus humi]|uniref:Uncharacterized protein n=1 Tax=Deinococcus humi TaxID=662880 RepID=A0A7W8JQX8_9DEIO|nr:hypothetical protein [Deinococcus humi]MBB5361300.1 hypothetical protein [Deinococcus humi]GGO19375.1 hypothetical protein GCM10008949_03660 [Deinococcus humi]